jgi:hypothetical protein
LAKKRALFLLSGDSMSHICGVDCLGHRSSSLEQVGGRSIFCSESLRWSYLYFFCLIFYRRIISCSFFWHASNKLVIWLSGEPS